MFKIEISGKTVEICETDVAIIRSCEIKNKHIKPFIKLLIEYKDYSPVLQQDYKLLCGEFLVHNLLYKLGISTQRTETVNLSNHKYISKREKFIYKIFLC